MSFAFLTHFWAVSDAETKQGIDDAVGNVKGQPTSVGEDSFSIFDCLLDSSETARTMD
jgi:hypothetical protein